ncbi:MAG TPA: undecaprenyl-phosphate glucose phosphotransferase [Flavobacteriales bacterium]|nr:undecaprenyl-phosphate glucose phosphotransferase [Flavobacteriales bacterium]
MTKRTGLVWFFLVYDIIVMTAAFWGSIYLKYKSFEPGSYSILLPLIILLWSVVSFTVTPSNLQFRQGLYTHLRGQVIEMLIFVGIVSSLVLALGLNLYSRLVLFGTILFFFAIRNIGFLLIYKYLSYMRQRGRHVKRVLVIGSGRIGQSINRLLKRDVTLGYNVIGFLDDGEPVSGLSILGSINDIEQIIVNDRVEEVVLAIPLTATEKISRVIEISEFHGLRVSMVPDYYRLVRRPFETYTLGDMPLVSIREVTLDGLFNKALKRAFDLVFSSAVLLLLSPVFLAISLAVKLTSRGPIFYTPTRIGIGGAEFKCLKFRSMVVDNSPNHHLKSTAKNDPRITRIGSFLRNQSLDELPQFINVLLGEMSVVGPRPHRKALNIDMQNEVSGYMLRHYVKPGITGWAQVNGWRGPTETQEQRTERTLHDLWYIENWTFWLDIRIIVMTIAGQSKQNAF